MGILSMIRSALRVLAAVILIALGVFLGNLDRLGQIDRIGIQILKYEDLMPRRIRRFLPGGSAPEGEAKKSQSLNGKIISVHDGDTANLLADGKKYKIRFYGIDAPEITQPFGERSRDVLRDKILGCDVTVEVVNTDQYGRAVGIVLIGSRCINREMVAEGFAWHYEAYAHGESDLQTAMLHARTKKLGLWRSADPQPPWEYRHKKQ